MVLICTISAANECEQRPCQNSGRCLNLIGGYRCLCAAYYRGINCETGIQQDVV